jgi:hypothetical protein
MPITTTRADYADQRYYAVGTGRFYWGETRETPETRETRETRRKPGRGNPGKPGTVSANPNA